MKSHKLQFVTTQLKNSELVQRKKRKSTLKQCIPFRVLLRTKETSKTFHPFMIPSLSLWQPSYLVKCNSETEICCVGVLKMLEQPLSFYSMGHSTFQSSISCFGILNCTLQGLGWLCLEAILQTYNIFFSLPSAKCHQPIDNNSLLLADQFES